MLVFKTENKFCYRKLKSGLPLTLFKKKNPMSMDFFRKSLHQSSMGSH